MKRERRARWTIAAMLALAAAGCEQILGLDQIQTYGSGGAGASQGGGGTTTTSGGGGTVSRCFDPATDCPAASNECRAPACDASGSCVEDDVPDGTLARTQVSGDCKQIVCQGGGLIDQVDDADLDDGKECTVDACELGSPSHSPKPAGEACTENGGVMCDAAGACVECVLESDCDDGIPQGPCHSFDCMGGECMQTTAPDGPAPSQVAGDCHVTLCQAGISMEAIDDVDSPDQPGDCIVDGCVSGVVVPSYEPDDTPCGMGAATTCDGQGSCVGCTDVADCPDPGPCAQSTCLQNVCGTAADPLDVPNDGSDCTTDICVGSTPMNNPLPLGTACGGGTRACDALGQCLGQPCMDSGMCPAGASCADGVCCSTACAAGCDACSAAAKGGSGLDGFCEAVPAGQDPMNAECPGPQVCNGTTGAAACKLPNGQACANGTECLSVLCVDAVCCNSLCSGVCQACNVTGLEGACSPIPNGQDPANECSGAVQCNGTGACGALLGNGAPCTMGSECSSGNCVDGNCCNSTCAGACRACNVAGSVGTCTNFMPNTDPGDAECPGLDVACDGAGVCKKVNGQGCAVSSECISAQCKDSVCCNNACGSLCQACNVAGSVGMCTNVPANTDPANECSGVTDCNGAGACTKLSTGTACTFNGECSTGACIDNFCCANLCSATCQACSMAKTGQANGTCANVTGNTDPDNECTGTADCNGSGACEAVNGTLCAMGPAQCISGFCVDGRCCNTDCSGVCQACSNAKTGQPNGTCANIASNTDPDSECVGGECSGSGACEAALGVACSVGADCQSGNCVDGVCCATATCSGTCKSCNQAFTVGGVAGACDNIVAGQDPNNECALACNGAGVCQ